MCCLLCYIYDKNKMVVWNIGLWHWCGQCQLCKISQFCSTSSLYHFLFSLPTWINTILTNIHNDRSFFSFYIFIYLLLWTENLTLMASLTFWVIEVKLGQMSTLRKRFINNFINLFINLLMDWFIQWILSLFAYIHGIKILQFLKFPVRDN